MLTVKQAGVFVLLAASGAWAQVVNPGFEDPIPNGDPANWNIEHFDPMFPVTSVRTSVTPHSGDWHMRMSVVGGADYQPAGSFIYQQFIPVTAGTTYDFSVWARLDSLTGSSTFAILSIFWANDVMTFDGTNTNITPGLTGDYQKFSLVSVAPAGATRAGLSVEWRAILNSGSGGVLDVDDVSFVPGPGGPAMLAAFGVIAFRRRRVD